jgi:hypothetical protein
MPALLAAVAAAAALVLAPAASAHPNGSPSISTIGALITKRPASPTNQTTAKFAWKRIGHVTKTLCRLDATPWRTCKTKITYKSLPPGVHTFRVKVSGRTGGRTRSATKKVRWTIDVTPPSAPVVSGGSAAWTAGPVTITGSGSTDPGGAVARYQHRTSPDGSAWSPAAAGGSVAVISPGQTFVQVRAVDTAGNASAWAPAVTGAANTAMVDAVGLRTADVNPVGRSSDRLECQCPAARSQGRSPDRSLIATTHAPFAVTNVSPERGRRVTPQRRAERNTFS